ncbi:MAG: PAS domain S-box protein [Armatimonadota bacterium]
MRPSHLSLVSAGVPAALIRGVEALINRLASSPGGYAHALCGMTPATCHAFQAAGGGDEGRRIVGTPAAGRDTSQLKEEQRQLEHLRLIAENTVDAIWVMDLDMRFTWVNSSVERITGYTREEWTGSRLAEHTTPDDFELMAEMFRDSLDIEPPSEGTVFETTIIHKDGHAVPVEISSRMIFDEQGNPLELQGVTRDITERKRAAEALRESEERYREFVHSANDIIYTLTPDGTIVSINGAVERILGFAPEEIEGRNLEEVLGPERHARAKEQYLRKIDEGEPSSHYEFDLLNRDGEEVVLEISTTIQWEDGEPVEVMGIARDITERKRAEDELLRRTHDLGERVKEMRCLYQLARLSQRDEEPVEEILPEIADLLSRSWQWPEVTSARIEFDDRIFEAGAANGPPVARQSAPIGVHGAAVGRVEVRYHEERPEEDEGPFAAEERALLDTVAVRIGEMLERREAEREREVLARFPAENPRPVLRVVADGIVNYANDAAMALLAELGLEVGDQVPRSWQETLARSPSPSRPCAMEVTAGDRVFAFTCAPVPEFGYVNFYGMDITEQRAAEEALIESEQRFRRAVANAPFPIMLHAAGGEVLTVNEVWVEATGYAAEEIPTVGDWTELAYDTDGDAVADYVSQLHELTGRVDEGEFVIRTADGDTRIWHFHSAPIGQLPDGRGLAMSIAMDVTKRRAAENALRESEERYRTVFENTGAATCLIDENRTIVLANQGFARLVGAPRDEIEGSLDFTEVIAPHEKERMVGYHDARRAPGREAPNRYEFDFVTLDGEMRRVFLHIDVIPGTETSVASLVDITELRQAQKELQVLTEELEERVRDRTAQLEAANAELEAFAYSVSHDLRAPLRAIDGFSQAVVEDYAEDLDDTARDYLRRVRRASQRMGSLIDDLLQLSRITRVELFRDRVDLSAMAREVVDELRAQHPERVVEVVIEPDMTADVDRRLIRTALSNLLGNAWKYTAKLSEAKIEFGSQAGEQGRRVYRVIDNGAGFDMQYAGKLFQPFQRLHREDEFPGTGIGLATVRRVIRRHGGDVWAEGAVDEGATFYFTLNEA